MKTQIKREDAIALLKKYNQEPFHLLHGLTVEGVMRWYAGEIGEDADFWGLAGLLHDVDTRRSTARKRRSFSRRSARNRSLSMRCAATDTDSPAMWSRRARWKNSCLPQTS